MAWTYLLIAGALEITWVISMKYSEGFSKTLPTGITIGAGYASFYFLSLAIETLPIGTAYAVWTGIGAVGTAVLGILFFGEQASVWRLLCILLIIAGVIGLKITGAPAV